MQVFSLVAILFVVGVCAEEVSNVQPNPSNVVPQPQSQVVSVHSVVEQPQVNPAHQPAVEHHHPNDGHQPQGDHFLNDGHQHHYAPTGVIQPVGSGAQQFSASEQYGKPESAAIPPNYKPFGSWGLYIGGNPADGYYSSYYKALGNSVDKQQVSAVEQASGFKPGPSPSGVQGQSAALSGPILKQASFPHSYDQVYPFDYYTPSDLNSGSRVAVVDQSGPSVYSAGAIPSPVQVGSQVYGVPVANYASEQPAFAYPDHYATKRIGSKVPERVQPVQQQQQQIKGYYAQSAVAPHYAAQPQVVAYPVPVGSQIVGSQPGTEGSYTPYGVHGYTRYAIKPTVVAASDSYFAQGVHSSPVSNFPVYKQQVGAVQPLSFYGYPLNQLHYSQNSLVPTFGPQGVAPPSQQGVLGVHPEQVGGPQVIASPVEAAGSDKSETQSSSEQKPKKA